MTKRVFYRGQRARMRANHETVKSAIESDDPYVAPPIIEPIVVTQVAEQQRVPGRSMSGGSFVTVGAPRSDIQHCPSVIFEPSSSDDRERLCRVIRGCLSARWTADGVNGFHHVDWNGLVDVLEKLGGVRASRVA